MQAISGSTHLLLSSTEAGSATDSASTLSSDMLSELGFLALFTSQVSSTTVELDRLKGKMVGSELGGKLFPQELPMRPILSDILAANGSSQLLDNKLFSNLNDLSLNSAQNLLEAIKGEGEEGDSFIQSLIQEAGSSKLGAKAVQTGTGFAAITSQLGKQGWGDELVSRVKWQIGQDIQEAKISLNPRELGPLQVKINIINDQAHVQFIAQHASVRDAVEDAIPRLREMLEQSGMMLADADVSQQSADQQGFFGTTSTPNESLADNVGEEEESVHHHKVIRVGVGLVDAFI